MPNWCWNLLQVTGNRAGLAEFKKKAKTKEVRDDKGELSSIGSDLSLNNFVPMPKELNIDRGYFGDDKLKQSEVDRIGKENLKKFGAKDWYDWHVQNWGTKWDVEATLQSKSGDMLEYWFDSAWAPPVQWLVSVSEQYPKLKFELEYDEPGMCFSGTATAENGELDDDYREGECNDGDSDE